MKVTALKIPDLKLIEPEVFEDERGYFFESFNQKKFPSNFVIFAQNVHFPWAPQELPGRSPTLSLNLHESALEWVSEADFSRIRISTPSRVFL